MNQPQFFETLIADWSLGAIARPPQPVSGGYMHRMFRLDTGSGSYAVKLLNPEVMSRPEARSNYQKAEALERVLEQNHLPVVAAMDRNGSKMQCIQGQYYYLFPWVEHKALPWNAITEAHCRIAGGLLARLHGLPHAAAGETDCPEPFTFDWEMTVKMIRENCDSLDTVLLALLTESLPLLTEAQAAYNRAIAALPPLHCICNADMDAKNVLWQGDEPLMIDLECLAIGNPVNDLVQLSLSWAGGVLCRIDQKQLQAFLDAYRKSSALPAMDWDAISGLGFAWLDWLHYNLRRACGLTGNSLSERELSLQESKNTLERIRYYAQVQPEVAAQFHKAMEN